MRNTLFSASGSVGQPARAARPLGTKAGRSARNGRRARGLTAVALAAAAATPVGLMLANQARADLTGFGDGSNYTFNGSTSQDDANSVKLTDAVNNEAGSVFSNNAQSITNFTA